MSCVIRIGVSADLIRTLIDVNGPGEQNLLAVYHFMKHFYGVDPATDLPVVDSAKMAKRFWAAYKYVAHRDRSQWLDAEAPTPRSPGDAHRLFPALRDAPVDPDVDADARVSLHELEAAVEQEIADVYAKDESSRGEGLLDALAALEPLDPKAREMPVGGTTDASQRRFWYEVIDRLIDVDEFKVIAEQAAQRSSRTRSGTRAPGVQSGKVNWPACWRYIYEHFATPAPYMWLRGGEKSVEGYCELRRLAAQMNSTFSLSSEPDTPHSCDAAQRRQATYAAMVELLGGPLPPLTFFEDNQVELRVAPLTIVSNCDARLSAAMSGMLKCKQAQYGAGTALAEGIKDGVYLPLFTSDAVGRAKPSPLGILSAVRAVQFLGDRAASSASKKRRSIASDPSKMTFSAPPPISCWIHTGDADEDAVAAERAGVRFVRCESTDGIAWPILQATIRDIVWSHVGELER